MESTSVVVDSTRAWHDLVYNVSQTSVELFLYGIYVHFFLSAIQNLSRRGATGRNIFFLTSWAMFLAATVQMVLQLASVAIYFRAVQLLAESSNLMASYQSLTSASHVILAINVLMGDSLFVYRCYVIWHSRKAVVILPITLMLSTLVWGVVIQYSTLNMVESTRSEFLLVFATNLVLTILTAGRIWWIKRKSLHIELQTSLQRRYNSAMVIITESGGLFCIWGILLAATVGIEPAGDSMAFGIILGIAKQGVNIVPALSIILGTRAADRDSTNSGGCSKCNSSARDNTLELRPDQSLTALV